jgi:predicted permease
MLGILSITGVIFVLIGLGFGSVRLKVFSSADMTVLGRLVVQIAARLARNPIVLALCAGVVVSVFHIPLPQILFRPVDILANASAAVSLIVIGGTLAGLSLSFLTISATLALVLP